MKMKFDFRIFLTLRCLVWGARPLSHFFHLLDWDFVVKVVKRNQCSIWFPRNCFDWLYPSLEFGHKSTKWSRRIVCHILFHLQKEVEFIGVSQIRAVFYTNHDEEIKHLTHVDIPFDSRGAEKFRIAVFYVNSCNGKTIIGDEEIEFKQN